MASDLRNIESKSRDPLLKITGLRTHFFTHDGIVKAVDGVDLSLNGGEILGLVGESGCGKTITALSILRLIASPGKIVEGSIIFEGEDLLGLPEKQMVRLRGERISMIFQQPKVSLNPVMRIGTQIAELFIRHQGLSRQASWNEAEQLLHAVGIPAVKSKIFSYPHELSGGQAQRVMIATALALKPRLLIADEPTTALDVTIQAQILDILRDLCKQLGTAMILVTHDLGVIAQTADRVAVMYAGQIIEQASVLDIFDHPSHPYTQGLIDSMPVLGETKDRFNVIEGNVPNLTDLPPGCRFAPRCKKMMPICKTENPQLWNIDSEHHTRCWLYTPEEAERV